MPGASNSVISTHKRNQSGIGNKGLLISEPAGLDQDTEKNLNIEELERDEDDDDEYSRAGKSTEKKLNKTVKPNQEEMQPKYLKGS